MPSGQWYNHPKHSTVTQGTCPLTVSLAIQSIRFTGVQSESSWTSVFIIFIHFPYLFSQSKKDFQDQLYPFLYSYLSYWKTLWFCICPSVCICPCICVHACGCMYTYRPASFSITPLPLLILDKGSLTQYKAHQFSKLDVQQSFQYPLVSIFSVLGL